MGVQQFILTKALKKVAVQIAVLLASYAAAHKADSFGITIDQNQLTIGLFGVFQGLRNWLKVKKGLDWL